MNQDKMLTIIFTGILVLCVFSVIKQFIKKLTLGKIKYEAKVSFINGNLIIGVMLSVMVVYSVLNQTKNSLSGSIGYAAISLLSISFLWMGLMKIGIKQGGIIDKQSAWKWSEIQSYTWSGEEIIFKCKNRIGKKMFLTETRWNLKVNNKKEIDAFVNKNISKYKKKIR